MTSAERSFEDVLRTLHRLHEADRSFRHAELRVRLDRIVIDAIQRFKAGK